VEEMPPSRGKGGLIPLRDGEFFFWQSGLKIKCPENTFTYGDICVIDLLGIVVAGHQHLSMAAVD
jgi:hypothetical protein